jgi:hypothetical protein
MKLTRLTIALTAASVIAVGAVNLAADASVRPEGGRTTDH